MTAHANLSTDRRCQIFIRFETSPGRRRCGASPTGENGIWTDAVGSAVDRDEVGRPLLAREMATGLHLPIGRTGGTAMDDVAVVAEDAGELLGDVCTAVSTASAGC